MARRDFIITMSRIEPYAEIIYQIGQYLMELHQRKHLSDGPPMAARQAQEGCRLVW